MAHPVPAADTAALSKGRTLRTARVLLVDDDLFTLSAVEAMLREFGVTHVAKAHSGESAISSSRWGSSSAPELVICDLNMPELDGFELMESLGKMAYAGGVVLMSGMDDRTMRSATLMARFHRLNILGTLPKPVQAPVLGALLAKLG